MRKITIFIVLAVAIIALLGLLVFNLEKLVAENRDAIIEQIESKIGRDIDVEDIKVSLWGGPSLNLTDLSVAEDPGFEGNEFLTLKNLKVNVAFLPLLTGKLEVKRFILEEPRIRIVKDPRGVYNYESIFKGSEPEDNAQKEEDEPSQDHLSISELKIRNGRIDFIDQTKGQHFKIAALNLDATNIAPNKPIDFQLRAGLFAEEQNVEINGRLTPPNSSPNFSNHSFEGDFAVGGLIFEDVERTFPQIRGLLPKGLDPSGPIYASGAVSGSEDSVSLKGAELEIGVFGSTSANLTLTGDFSNLGTGAEDLRFDGNIRLDKTEFTKLRDFEYLTDSFPPQLSGSGPVSVDADFKGGIDDLILVTEVDATDAHIAYADTFDKPVGVPFLITSRERVKKDSVEIQDSKITVKNLVLTTIGIINLGDNPQYRVSIRAPKTSIAGWDRLFPQMGLTNPEGSVELDLKLKGYTQDAGIPSIEGWVELEDIGGQLPDLPHPIRALNAKADFFGNSASIEDGTLSIGGTKIDFKGTVASFEPLEINYSLISSNVDLGDFMQSGFLADKKTSLRDFRYEGKFSKTKAGFTNYGNIESGRGTISSIGYNGFKTKISQSAGILAIKDLNLKTLDGIIKLNAKYDSSETIPLFDLNTDIKNLMLTELLSSFAPRLSAHLSGVSNLRLSLKGKGADWEQISETLSGTGFFEIKNGELKKLNVADGVLSGIAALQTFSQVINPGLKSRHPALFNFENTKFYSLKSRLSIDKGRINFEDLALKAQDYSAAANGWIGINKSTDIKALLVMSDTLSKDLISSTPSFAYLTNASGQVEIPFAIRGTLPNITPTPDSSLITRIIQKKVIDKGSEKIGEQFKNLLKKRLPEKRDASGKTQIDQSSETTTRQSTEPDENAAEEDIGEQIIREGIKGLFKKIGKGSERGSQ